jgi:hypothetical protein
MTNVDFQGVKVFSATMAGDRAQLGERLTAWLREHPTLEIVDKRVLQSSDERFHCITIVIFYRGDAG